jgi:hypothetical protein
MQQKKLVSGHARSVSFFQEQLALLRQMYSTTQLGHYHGRQHHPQHKVEAQDQTQHGWWVLT